MKQTLLTLIFLCFSLTAFSAGGDPPVYKLYNKDGKASTYKELLKSAEGADVILFGELHNNSMSHWMQALLTRDLIAAKGKNIVLGAEMFETDQQSILDSFLAGTMPADTMGKRTKLWPNYESDYHPLVEKAKAAGIPFIATNTPRKYSRLVSKGGLSALDTLSPFAKSIITPLPMKVDTTLRCYRDMREMSHMSGMGVNVDNFIYAQALKDATMAAFILKNRKAGQTFIHYNGAWHSDRHEGIGWFLKQADPSLKILVITTVESEKCAAPGKDDAGKADYFLATDMDVIKSY